MDPRHPIARNNYLILTKPIETATRSITAWIKFNFPGAMVFGQRRRGKSRLIRFLRNHLSDLLGFKIAIAVLCMRKHDLVREGDFLDDLLDVLDVRAGPRAAKKEKMALIRNALLVLARRSPVHKVMLIIDDAQRLQSLHYEILMSIENELDERFQVSLFTLLVGQPELLTKKELMIASGQLQITARMMADEIEFYGHRTAEELEYAWGRYAKCFWPRKSGISFLQAFAPGAVARGWDLSDEAPGVWQAYKAEREVLNISPVEEMSGQALTTMAHYILSEYASKPDFVHLSDEQCSAVVRKAGFLRIEPVQGTQPSTTSEE